MLDEENFLLTFLDDLAPNNKNKLKGDVVLDKVRKTRRGGHEMWLVGLKGQLLRKSQTIS